MGIGYCIENVQSTIVRQSWGFTFYFLEIHSFETVVHILFATKAVFPKGLEPMLVLNKLRKKTKGEKVQGAHLQTNIPIFCVTDNIL